MIQEGEIIEVGKFFKAHGLKGEMNVVVDYNPEILEHGYPLIVDMDGIYVPFYAESVRPKGAQSSLVKLEKIDTKEETTAFVNKIIYMLRRDVAQFLEVEESELAQDGDVTGYQLVDNTLGSLGEIVEIDDTTENILLTVKPSNSDDTITIPFRDEFITEYDDARKILTIDLPESIRDFIQ